MTFLLGLWWSRKVENPVDDKSHSGMEFFSLQPNFRDAHTVPRREVSDFAKELKRLFKDAYSSDDYTPAILL